MFPLIWTWWALQIVAGWLQHSRNDGAENHHSSSCSSKPHVLFLFADDLGWADIGYHEPSILSPNINALAKDGILLTNYYTHYMCTPARAALMTGKYAHRVGLQHHVIVTGIAAGLPLNESTIADYFKVLGYSTHAIGKWHLGRAKWHYTPRYRGFDSFRGYWLGQGHYYNHTHQNANSSIYGYDFHENEERLDDRGTYSMQLFMEKAVSIVTEHDPCTPLFLYLPLQAAHTPLMAPPMFMSNYSHFENTPRAMFAASVTYMDHVIGELIEVYKQKGLLDNTVVVFASDNGGTNHGMGFNYPLRGVKQTVWEGGTHAPAFVWSPLIPEHRRGREWDGLMHVIDWLPTLVAGVAGGALSFGMDGLNQWSNIITGASSAHEHLLIHIDSYADLPCSSLRWGSYKLNVNASCYKHLPDNPDGTSDWLAPPDSGKESFYADYDDLFSKDVRLYDLSSDPSEQLDISDSHPDVVSHMLELLEGYKAEEVVSQLVLLSRDPLDNPSLYGGDYVPWLDDYTHPPPV